MIPLALVVGEGPRFGTGHIVRMRELRAILKDRGLEISDWHTVDGFDGGASLPPLVRSESLVILDARDLDPRPFARQGARVLALDNRHACRDVPAKPSNGPSESSEAIEFYDTIPHPRANLRDTLERVLLSPDVRALIESVDGAAVPRPAMPIENQRRALFVYSGDFAAPRLDEALLRLCEDGWSVHRCGSAPPAGGFARRPHGMRYSARLERADFLRELAAADRVWTYFGMTLLEAWFLQRECSMLPVDSAVHAELADYLQRAAGLGLVQPAAVLTSGADAFADGPSPADLRPGGLGFDLLVQRIRARIADLDPRI